MADHPIIPPLELLKHWEDQHFDEGENYDVMLIEAYQAGADRQLEQDARWLDTHALFTSNLTVTPSGDALRQVMRPKPLSLREQALHALENADGADYPVVATVLTADQHALIRRALEQLDD